MNKRGCLTLLSIVLAIGLLPILLGCFFAVYQTEQVIITQFGKPVGEPITHPGLHFKLPRIQYRRLKIEDEIKSKAAGKLAEFGIDLLDVRLKRVNYNPDVLDRIYQRMISERRQIAQRFRSEGEGEAARIAGQKERDLNEIQSTAYRQVQQIPGQADANATESYPHAYTQNPQAAEFYTFLNSMDTYRKVLTKDSTLVFSTDSDLFGLLKRASAKPQTLPPAH